MIKMDLNSFINTGAETKRFKISCIGEEGFLVKTYQKGTSKENALFLFFEKNPHLKSKFREIEEVHK